jgi:hypothetical protein
LGHADTIRSSLNVEPLSPELVLVDPDLARDDRTWLRQPAWRSAAHTGTVNRLPHRLTPDGRLLAVAPRGWRDTLQRLGEHGVLVLLAISLLANGVFVAGVLSGGGAALRTVVVTPPPVSDAEAAKEGIGRPSPRPPGSRPRGASRTTRQSTGRPAAPAAHRTVATHQARAAVERKILTLLIESPAGKLPRALVDQETGLAKNNLQAICRKKTRALYVCLVHPSGHRANEGLPVRYRLTRDGRDVITWGRYRSG